MQIKAIRVGKNMRKKKPDSYLLSRACLIPSWVLFARYISPSSKKAISPCFKKSNFNLTTISFPKPDIVSYEAKNDFYQIPYDSHPLNPLP